VFSKENCSAMMIASMKGSTKMERNTDKAAMKKRITITDYYCYYCKNCAYLTNCFSFSYFICVSLRTGKLSSVNGKIYEGEWKDGKMDGKGIYAQQLLFHKNLELKIKI